jgi:outer membrane protein assembly factor BamA
LRLSIKKTCYFIAISLLLTACNISKHFSDKEYLLNKNSISIKGNKKNINPEEIKSLIQQNPNSSFFGLARIKMWIYLWTDHPDRSKFTKWINKSLGEKPVIFSARDANLSKSQMVGYLNNIGYFNTKVSYARTINKRKNKVDLLYNIKLNKPYTISRIDFNIDDNLIRYMVLANNFRSKLDTGLVYNAYVLEDIRDKISTTLKNNGYYDFNKEYVYFEVDTTLGNKKLSISLNIPNTNKKVGDTTIKEDHKRYFINKVFINTNYDPLGNVNTVSDTNLFLVSVGRSDSLPYYFIHQNKIKIKPQAVTQSIFINPGQPFVLNQVQRTYKRLNDIRIFKYANIQFSEINPSGANPPQTNKNYLNCNILLTRAKLQAYTIEAEGTNTGGDLGLGGNLTYQNRNIFRGAEVLSLKLKGAMEIQRLSTVEQEDASDAFLFFNTMETGAEINLYFPRFLAPVKQTIFPKYFKPRTSISTGINFQRRPNYERYITNISFGYDWNESELKKHILIPAEINLVKVNPSAEFDSILQNLENQRLKNQFTDHLIVAAKYSFVFNNQKINKLTNFIYFRGNLEASGNLLQLTDQIIKAPKDGDGNYSLFNIRYAQYIRTDLDFRYYILLTEKSRIAIRALFGIGVPYGNSEALPFEKGFYGGGANGMRAWEFRSLGPGTYQNTQTGFDRMGDMKIEGNIEYRFPIYSFFNGALFLDAGNIWLLKNDVTLPGGKFKVDTFMDEFAIDGGLGFRFDFGFFLFRIDGAIVLRDPALPPGKRWDWNGIGLENINWNFGIGYPF